MAFAAGFTSRRLEKVFILRTFYILQFAYYVKRDKTTSIIISKSLGISS